MNNKRSAYVTTKGVMLATAASLALVPTTSLAAEKQLPEDEPKSVESSPAIAGVFAATNLNSKDLRNIEVLAAPTTEAGVFAATNHIHENLASDNGINIFGSAFKGGFGELDFSKILMASESDGSVTIRNTPALDGEVTGLLRDHDLANIIGQEGGWYHIKSGEVTGYVNELYCITGDTAKARFDAVCKSYITCQVRKLNVRSGPSTSTTNIGTLIRNEVVTIDTTAAPVEGWVAIHYDTGRGYVSTDFVEVTEGVSGTAITAAEIPAYEEEQAAKEAERIASIKKGSASGSVSSASNQTNVRPQAIQNEAVVASVDDETLMAALLQCEAGSSYEGMLAVGGVVMNRLRAGYAGDIHGVIYQKSQFSPAGSGKVARVIANNSISETAFQAARAALAGEDITGGCLNFRAAYTGHSGVNIGGNVFF